MAQSYYNPRSYGMPVWPAGSLALDPAAAQAPTSNTNAVVRWSYNGSPSTGTLVIGWNDSSGNAQTETYYITASGPGFLPLRRIFPSGVAVTFTLLAQSGVSGSIYGDAELSG